jgi:hypothetical protein
LIASLKKGEAQEARAMAGGALRLRAGERKGGWLEEEGSADGRGPAVNEREGKWEWAGAGMPGWNRKWAGGSEFGPRGPKGEGGEGWGFWGFF